MGFCKSLTAVSVLMGASAVFVDNAKWKCNTRPARRPLDRRIGGAGRQSRLRVSFTAYSFVPSRL